MLYPGTSKEVKVIYKKALKVKGAAKFLGFKRNTRYTLVVRNAIPGKVEIDVQVDKWNEETLTANLEPNVPRLEFYYSYAKKGYSYSPAKTPTEVILDKDLLVQGSNYIAFAAKEANNDFSIYYNGQAIRNDNTGTNINGWLLVFQAQSPWFGAQDQMKFKRSLYIRVLKQNKTGKDRSVRLVLKSKLDPSLQSVFTIRQKG